MHSDPVSNPAEIIAYLLQVLVFVIRALIKSQDFITLKASRIFDANQFYLLSCPCFKLRYALLDINKDI